jgi:glycosyltransferase involved in cell wall biosynthesis
MRILLITPTLPIPTSGGRTRLFNLVKHLSRRHEVSVICFLQPGEGQSLPSLALYCRNLVTVPFAPLHSSGKWRNRTLGWSQILFRSRPRFASTFPVDTMREPLRQVLRSGAYDVAVLNNLALVELSDELGALPAVLAEENVESDVARQAWHVAQNPVHRLRDWLTWRRLVAFEKYWLGRFSVCAAVSEDDAALLRRMSPASQVHVVPNGVDTEFFAPPSSPAGEKLSTEPELPGGIDREPLEAREPVEPQTPHLLFSGVLTYAPNVQGLTWFCDQVLPRILAAQPQAVLEICGLHMSPSVLALGRHPAVHVTGFVPDLRPKLWSATASVAPLWIGGGTRLKILEALAAECPVVTTSVGAKGLSLVDGRHLLVADTAATFADRVLDLLASTDLRRRLATAGRQAVVEAYDWQSIAPLLEAACEHAMELAG